MAESRAQVLAQVERHRGALANVAKEHKDQGQWKCNHNHGLTSDNCAARVKLRFAHWSNF
eukprot:2508693-Amphidinium_carterae.1